MSDSVLSLLLVTLTELVSELVTSATSASVVLSSATSSALLPDSTVILGASSEVSPDAIASLLELSPPHATNVNAKIIIINKLIIFFIFNTSLLIIRRQIIRKVPKIKKNPQNVSCRLYK